MLKIKEKSFSKDYCYDQLIRAKRLMDEQYDRTLDLEAISKAAFLSKYHFIRWFKRAYGITPKQYLTSVRIAKAKRLLRSGNSVTEVCGLVGFESAGSFTRLFKKICGFTPSAYQQAQKSNFG